MFELTQHIESLLLNNDCVVVPHLGGFVTSSQPAHWVAEENLFFPPTRSVGFNPQLTINDGLLTLSYMQANDVSYPDAQKLVENDVAHIKEVILSQGEFMFDGIGKLSLRQDGHYDFTPIEAGVVSPDLYGLDSVEIGRIQSQAETQKATVRTWGKAWKAFRPLHKVQRGHAHMLRQTITQTAAVAIVTLLLYFAWSTPIQQAPYSQDMQANLASSLIFSDEPKPQSAGKQQAVVLKETTATTDTHETAPVKPVTASTKPASAAASRPEITHTETVPPSKSYTIVLASAVSSRNAHAFVDRLTKQGYKDVSVYKKQKMVRVIYGHFASENEAFNELKRLHNSEEFAEAWVLALP